jgi:peptide/nickel transport system permease protein/oligopeptide transport system permease protein
MSIVVVYLTLTVPAVILDESFLSFLGLGIQPPQSSLGSLLAEGAEVINPIHSYWWLLVFPALVMCITLLAMNFLGDAIREATDPRTRRAAEEMKRIPNATGKAGVSISRGPA